MTWIDGEPKQLVPGMFIKVQPRNSPVEIYFIGELNPALGSCSCCSMDLPIIAYCVDMVADVQAVLGN